MFFVTTLTKMEKNERFRHYDFGSTRTVGVFKTLEEAREVVINNYGDICETIYDYALIESVEYGLYPNVTTQELYKVKNPTQLIDGKEYYNPDLNYEKIELPKDFPKYSIVVG